MRNPVPITYRDFYDVPRMFVAEWAGTRYLFDCPFDDASDDYSDCYAVYTLDSLTAQDLAGSWVTLPERGVRLTSCVPVTSVRFDSTRRESVSADVLVAVQADWRTACRSQG